MKRYIALADCDCFFVSAERAFNPKLLNRPVAVLSNNDGCVISRSAEAKKLGLKMGEPYFMAKNRLPEILYIRANHELYKQTSQKVMSLLKSYTPDVEVCSVDEAYLDLTGTKRLYKKNYIEIARMIRETVLRELNIPVSIGLSTTKTLAKLASDKAKTTGGIYAIGSAERSKILGQTKIEDIAGIGRKLVNQMRQECIFTALDFISRPDAWIKATFGAHGMDLKNELCGKLLFKVTPQGKAPLSIQQTAALKTFTRNYEDLAADLQEHIHTACRKARKEGAKAAALEVMVRTKDFKVLTLKEKLEFPTAEETIITPIALRLLKSLYTPAIMWRSTGITLAPLSYSNDEQLELFNNKPRKEPTLGKTLDALEQKFGKNIIHLGLNEKKEIK